MNEETRNLYAAIGRGETVQYRTTLNSDWHDWRNYVFVGHHHFLWRIKPRTISINGVEIPEPVREPLNDGDRYFAPKMVSHDRFAVATWRGDSVDKTLLNRGLIFRTEEDAKAAARALILALGGEV